jgi:hypothetical protein
MYVHVMCMCMHVTIGRTSYKLSIYTHNRLS